MKCRLLSLLTMFMCFFCLNAQTWSFNTTYGLQGWSPYRFSTNYTGNSIIFTTNGQTNPRLDHGAANINAATNKFAEITMKIGANGPTLLRINFGSNFKSRVVSNGNSNFVTYTVNMTDVAWDGNINDIQIAFKDDNGTPGGANHNSNGNTVEIQEIKFIPNPYTGATVLYVDPINGNNSNTGVSSSAPLATIPYALDTAAANNISSVYIKSGTYSFANTINITTSSTQPITLSPEPGGIVKILAQGNRTFRFYGNAKNIEVKGLDIDGKSYTTNHWTMLSKYVWLPDTITPAIQGGGIAFSVEDSEDIKITDNIIHDYYQKAVNITDGRYVTVKGNIIYNIALTSLSGGHGIMRQQGSGSFSSADDPLKYRWDIDGNLIYNVQQRIYSWVPSKGYLNMTLDEGKPVLIDETPNHDQNMRARIQNNIVAYFAIDGIRLKPTNNLEVKNNSLFSTDVSHGDGITDTTSGFTGSGSPFNNFQCFNNVVQVNALRQSYELGDAFASTNAAFGSNYASFGTVSPSNSATAINSPAFVNAPMGNFNLSSQIPSGNGVPSTVINVLMAKANSANLTVADNNWVTDHLKNAQTLFDNVPGVEDGIAGNETVFTDAGTYDVSDLEFNAGRKSLYFSVNPSWKTNAGVTDNVLNHGNGLDIYDGKYEIVTPEAYSAWYDAVKATYLRDSDNNGTDDTPYANIRYGASVIAQNKVFNNNSLHVVEILSATNFTQTVAANYNIILDGDILIDFKNTPTGTESYDLITAETITSANAGAIWDRVRIVGYSGNYTLQIIAGNILRLTLNNQTLAVAEAKLDNMSEIQLYPNPADSKTGFYLSATSLSKHAAIKLYSLTGQEVQIKVVPEQGRLKIIPVNELQEKIYLMTISNRDINRSFKVLIK